MSDDRDWPSPHQLGPVFVGIVLLFGVAGLACYAAGGTGALWHLVDLDGERTLPAAFSSLVLLAGAACSVALAHRRALDARFNWLLFGFLLAFMAIDEFLMIHESLETSAAVDWQTLYAPVIAVCGVAWLAITARFYRRSRPAFVLMLAGAGMWLAAQALENLEWGAHDQAVVGYGYMMVMEEMLEMGGSVCFLIALYATLWAERTGRVFDWTYKSGRHLVDERTNAE